MAYYLGLDAGGTKTECALAHGSTILARASAGTIKIMRASHDEATKHLDIILRSLVAQAGVELNSIACTCVGLAGITVPRVADWVSQALHARVGGDLLLCGDVEIALDAAFCGGPGVLVMAGTGSNVVARSSDGQLIHIGGWGPVLADEGSGIWIGKQAVRAIFEALDRGESTQLLEKVQQVWSLPDLAGLIDVANQMPGPDFSKLTPLVVLCAEQGDSYAQRVLQQAGKELGTYVSLALRRLQTAERPPVKLPEIAYTGSILRQIATVQEAMRATIQQEFPDVRIQAKAIDPVEGALWRARAHFESKSDGVQDTRNSESLE